MPSYIRLGLEIAKSFYRIIFFNQMVDCGLQPKLYIMAVDMAVSQK